MTVDLWKKFIFLTLVPFYRWYHLGQHFLWISPKNRKYSHWSGKNCSLDTRQASTERLLQKIWWNRLSTRRKNHKIVQCHKLSSILLPPKHNEIHQYPTRQGQYCYGIQCHTNQYIDSFSFLRLDFGINCPIVFNKTHPYLIWNVLLYQIPLLHRNHFMMGPVFVKSCILDRDLNAQ